MTTFSASSRSSPFDSPPSALSLSPGGPATSPPMIEHCPVHEGGAPTRAGIALSSPDGYKPSRPDSFRNVDTMSPSAADFKLSSTATVPPQSPFELAKGYASCSVAPSRFPNGSPNHETYPMASVSKPVAYSQDVYAPSPSLELTPNQSQNLAPQPFSAYCRLPSNYGVHDATKLGPPYHTSNPGQTYTSPSFSEMSSTACDARDSSYFSFKAPPAPSSAAVSPMYRPLSAPESPAIGSMQRDEGPVHELQQQQQQPPNFGKTSGGGRTAVVQPTQQLDRPFKCDVCIQSFNRNHDLKRHRRIHLAIKPFPCGWCDKAFSRKDALKRHLLVKGCAGPKGATIEESVEKAFADRRAATAPASAVAGMSPPCTSRPSTEAPPRPDFTFSASGQKPNLLSTSPVQDVRLPAMQDAHSSSSANSSYPPGGGFNRAELYSVCGSSMDTSAGGFGGDAASSSSSSLLGIGDMRSPAITYPCAWNSIQPSLQSNQQVAPPASAGGFTFAPADSFSPPSHHVFPAPQALPGYGFPYTVSSSGSLPTRQVGHATAADKDCYSAVSGGSAPASQTDSFSSTLKRERSDSFEEGPSRLGVKGDGRLQQRPRW